jgi:ABC-type uncharacterized transport system involved in gliding motility auxiliary subunit
VGVIMATQEHKRKVATQAGLYLFVVVAIAVVVNLLAAKVYGRWDVTKNERYTLSQGSGRLLSTLKSPIQLDAYVKKGLPQLDAFVRDLTDLLKEYERAGKGKFKFTVIEPNTDELRAQAKEAGLQEQPFGEASATGEDQASIAQGFLGLVFKYGSEKATIPQLSPGQTDGLEFWITNKIREIRDKADDVKHRIGVVSNKDELKLSDTNLVPKQGRGGGSPSLQSIIEQAFPFYKVEEVDLKDGASEIDKDLVGLIITQPQKDYTEKELRRIDEFLLRGKKSLVVYASAVTMKPNDASMRATLSTHGLDKLLTGYGIQMNKDAVFDFGAQFRIGMMSPQTGTVTWVRHPGIAHVVNDSRVDEEDKRFLKTDFAGFFRMDEVVFPFPSSLELIRAKQPADVKLEAVARTTERTSVDKSESIDMKMRDEWKPKPPQKQRIIAAVAEGKLKSAFAGSPSDEVKLSVERAPEASRVLVISSSQYLTNPFAYAGNGPELGGQFQMFGGVGGDQQLQQVAQVYAKHLTGMILSFKNTLDWMSGDADLLAASAKLIGVPTLTYASVSKPTFKAEDDEAEMKRKDEEYRAARKDVQRNVQWSLTLGVPVLFGLFGLFRWRQRETKRDNIKLPNVR